MKKLFPLLLMTLFLASFLPAHALVLNAGYFLYIPIHVNSLSAIIYAVGSNATVTVALMTPSEFSQFNSTGLLRGIVVQNGSAIVNGVLANPGTYYLVIYSPTQYANIWYLYNTKSITPENSSTYVKEFVTIPPNGTYSLPIHLSTLGSPSTLLLFGVSNQTVYYTVFNNESQVFFNSSLITLTWNYTSETGFTVDLPTGVYFLNITNPHDTPAYLLFTYRVLPKYVNPYLYIEITHTNAYPMGIASYGVSGTKTYVVNTTSVLGYFNITSLLAYNGSQNLVPAYEASLQLNSVLVINNDDNSTWILWPQDVLIFLTNESVVCYHDNVFNMTNPTATLTNQSIKGDGYVYKNYYGNYNSSPCFTYSLPFSGYLVMNESVVKGKGVLITFSVIVLENGSSAVLSSQTFDEVLVVDPNVSSAYFQVNGMEYTPAGPTAGLYGSYYDTELVFGGGGNGEVTTFENISATLGLFYLQNNEYVEFPSYYTFGGDTAEATTNVHVTFTPQGYAELSVGKPDLTYVVINSPLTLQIKTTTSGAVQTTTTQSNTTQTSVTTTTTTTTATQSATSSTTTTPAQTSITSTTTQTTTPQTSVPSQTSSGQSITYVILTGVILLVYYALSRALRRRK